MQIEKDYDLTKFNTFGISAKAEFFAEVKSEVDIEELFVLPEFKDNQKLFLGGGSNVLFTKDFNGIVILNRLKGIEILNDDPEKVLVRAMGGEWWNDLVTFSVEHGFWGIENLSLIPGTVGASPVQNIGAYGVELKDVLENVEAFNIETGEKKVFTNNECRFGYRDSIFKQELKGKYFICAITLRLKKEAEKNTNYKALQEYLKENNLEIKTSRDVSGAISAIRRSKLPDPKILGNAGSFFKNVYVAKEQFEKLKNKFPDIPSFIDGDNIKIPSGWLIEQCGPPEGEASWKGYRVGNVGVHERQALVLVNYGGATGAEILDLANQIITSVYKKFSLKLIPEVNFV